MCYLNNTITPDNSCDHFISLFFAQYLMSFSTLCRVTVLFLFKEQLVFPS